MSFHRKKSYAGDGKTSTLPTLAHEKSSSESQTVSSNWGDQIAVGEAELVVLELYLAEAIDRLIGPKQKRGKGPSQARGPP
jgi:hypothetical protein